MNGDSLKVIGGIPVTVEDPENLGRTLLWYGPFGAGKTHAACTALYVGKVGFIVTDANFFATYSQFPTTNTQFVVHIPRLDANMKINPTAFDSWVAVINDLWKDPRGVDFLVFDSLTTPTDMSIDRIAQRAAKDPLDDALEIKHWGQQSRHIMAKCGNVIQELAKRHKIYCIAIAHARVAEDKKRGIQQMTPTIGSQATGMVIGKEYEEVWYFEPCPLAGSAMKSGFRARTRGDNLILAKTTISTLPGFLLAEKGQLDMRYILEERRKHIEKVRAERVKLVRQTSKEGEEV